jgi:hypothetical protein
MQKQQRVSSTYHVTMDDDKLGIKPEVLVGMYNVIDSKARQLAPEETRSELAISQDGRNKTKFYVAVSSRMAPYFIAAIQQHVDSDYGIGLRSYFHKLQEQIMSQMFT